MVGSFILLLAFLNLAVLFYKFDNLGSFYETKQSYLNHFPFFLRNPYIINAIALTGLVFAMFFFRLSAKQDELRFLSIIGIMGNIIFIGASVWVML
ncbi:hypothetical protein SAMN04488096_10528 [Mesonia phycicola]|uniref:Uncharacterized protein n=1 Tax=Mesonia phycicola TaxID=579105 RepID=A0A1M6ED62_9FLAO|nr:hypothetical protein SAMN04488096_10528 [Mesonia phycicola]